LQGALGGLEGFREIIALTDGLGEIALLDHVPTEFI
jgi:hypothetical protein